MEQYLLGIPLIWLIFALVAQIVLEESPEKRNVKYAEIVNANGDKKIVAYIGRKWFVFNQREYFNGRWFDEKDNKGYNTYEEAKEDIDKHFKERDNDLYNKNSKIIIKIRKLKD